MRTQDIPQRRFVLIAGPTAAGKSGLAGKIASERGGTVVNADAMQVYSCWRVLTARPSAADEAAVPHALYGHVRHDAPYSVGTWLEELKRLVATDERTLVIVGGTGLYFTALTAGLSSIPEIPPEIRDRSGRIVGDRGVDALLADLAESDARTYEAIDKSNTARVRRAWEVLKATGRGMAFWHERTGAPLLPLAETYPILLHVRRGRLAERIAHRAEAMASGGALEECSAMAEGWNPALPSSKAIGAREFMDHVEGRLSLEEAVARTIVSTRRYAKRQMTWFRGRMRDWNWVEAE